MSRPLPAVDACGEEPLRGPLRSGSNRQRVRPRTRHAAATATEATQKAHIQHVLTAIAVNIERLGPMSPTEEAPTAPSAYCFPGLPRPARDDRSPGGPRAPDLGTFKIPDGAKLTSWRMMTGEACLARTTGPVRHGLDHCGLVAPASGEGAEGLGRGPALESLAGRRHRVGTAAPCRCAAV